MAPSHSAIESIRRWLYPLSNLVRRMIRTMSDKLRELLLSKEGLLSILGVLVSLIATWPFILASLPTTVKPQDWAQWGLEILGGWVLIGGLIGLVWFILRRMDRAIRTNEVQDAINRDTNLITAINTAAGERDNRLIDTLNTLNQTLQVLQEQNKAIVTTLERLVQGMEDGKID